MNLPKATYYQGHRWIYPRRYLEILRTCRHIYPEALHILHTEVTWHIDVTNSTWKRPSSYTLKIGNEPIAPGRCTFAGFEKALPHLRRFMITVGCSKEHNLIVTTIDDVSKYLQLVSKIDYLHLKLNEAEVKQFASTIGVVFGLLRNVKTVVIDTETRDFDPIELERKMDSGVFGSDSGGYGPGHRPDQGWTLVWDKWFQDLKTKMQGSGPISPLPGMFWELEDYVWGLRVPTRQLLELDLLYARRWMEEDDLKAFKWSRAGIMGKLMEYLEIYRVDRTLDDAPAEWFEDEESEEEVGR